MKALIMAGGLGKRLRPLTNKLPKPMVNVGGKPIIYWQIKWLESYGVDSFVLLGGYKGRILINYIKSIGYGDRFQFSIEKKPLGSAGALNHAKNLLKDDEEFLVVNGDNITNLDIRKLKLDKNRLVCMALIPYKSTRGVVKFSGNVVTKFEEKQFIDGCWVNAGVLLLSRKILRMLPKTGGLELDLFPKIAKKGQISCVKFGKEYFNSVDSIKDREEVEKHMEMGKIRFNFR